MSEGRGRRRYRGAQRHDRQVQLLRVRPDLLPVTSSSLGAKGRVPRAAALSERDRNQLIRTTIKPAMLASAASAAHALARRLRHAPRTTKGTFGRHRSDARQSVQFEKSARMPCGGT